MKNSPKKISSSRNFFCYAIDCDRPIPKSDLFCHSHWHQLPHRLQKAIWNNYRPGQEHDLCPSFDYVRAALEAMNWLAEREGKPGIDIKKRLSRYRKYFNHVRNPK